MKFKFTLSAAAAQQIKRSAEEQAGEPRLRVAAKLAEDGSVEYGMGFDEERERDTQVHSRGVTVLVGPLSLALLDGASLDFVELTPGEYQFIFINPNDARAEHDDGHAGAPAKR